MLYRVCRDAAWLAIQEAAKHCTAVRMRTHLGNPAQTFAALENMVQTTVSKLSSTPPPPPSDQTASNTPLYAVPAARGSSGGPLLEPSTMLLEFMHGLEKNMYCTYAGSCIRPGVGGSAVSFYKSNRKVSQHLSCPTGYRHFAHYNSESCAGPLHLSGHV